MHALTSIHFYKSIFYKCKRFNEYVTMPTRGHFATVTSLHFYKPTLQLVFIFTSVNRFFKYVTLQVLGPTRSCFAIVKF